MHRIVCLGLVGLLAGLSGCSICASPFDHDYGFYGGTWERHDACRGRVGSRFYNAGTPAFAPQEEEIDTPAEPMPSEAPEPPTRSPGDMTDPILTTPESAPSTAARPAR